MKKFTTFIALCLFVVFTSCNDDNSVEDNQNSYKQFNKPGDLNLAQAAEALGLNELLAAVTYVDEDPSTQAGLAAALTSDDLQLTVFAPTDAAFEGLYSVLSTARGETIDEITDIPAPIVLAVLQYHITSGRRGSNSVLPNGNKDKVIQTMLDGATFSVDKDGKITDVGGSSLGALQYDIAIALPNQSASNGMAHGITGVMLPLSAGDIFELWPLP